MLPTKAIQDNKSSRAHRRPARQGLYPARFFLLAFFVWVIVGALTLVGEENRGIYRFVNLHHTPFADISFSYLTHFGEAPVICACLLLLPLAAKKFRQPRFLLTMVACNIVPFLLTQAVKALINAPRPLKYFEEASWINRVAGQPVNYNYSFPSGHSEGVFAFTCFLALLLPCKYRHFSWLLFLLALAVGYSRIYLSQHFYADVYAGSIIGTLGCCATYLLMNPFKHIANP
ncbi:MAG: phosphatase PAP2 family protein [Edaphocola sp.]